MNRENKHIIDDLELTPIQIPSDLYFEELKKSVLNEIGNGGLKKKREAQIISMYKRWYVWGSAAAILVLALLFPWNNTNSPVNSEPINLSSVSNEEIYNYLNENIEDLDAETIAMHLSNNVITVSLNTEPEKSASEKEKQETFTSKSPLLEHIEDEEIIDYLKDDPDSYRDGELDEYLLIES